MQRSYPYNSRGVVGAPRAYLGSRSQELSQLYSAGPNTPYTPFDYQSYNQTVPVYGSNSRSRFDEKSDYFGYRPQSMQDIYRQPAPQAYRPRMQVYVGLPRDRSGRPPPPRRYPGQKQYFRYTEDVEEEDYMDRRVAARKLQGMSNDPNSYSGGSYGGSPSQGRDRSSWYKKWWCGS